jgi:hypothetical protein
VFLRFYYLSSTYISNSFELVYLKSFIGLKEVSFKYYYRYSI